MEYMLNGSGFLNVDGKRIPLTKSPINVDDLETGREYTIFIEDENGEKSAERKVKCGFVPGTVVNYLNPGDSGYDFSGKFLCSPSLPGLPSGALLASNDIFGHSMPQNLTMLYRSEDDGATWSEPTVILRGSEQTSEKGPHKAPCVICKSHGRLWTAIEYGAWAKNAFSSGVLSIDCDADLMIAENWTCSEFLP